MSAITQSQSSKHKPQPSKDARLVKVVAKPQPSGLSREEMRHIIEMIG